mgnify:CR=1 FL=1
MIRAFLALPLPDTVLSALRVQQFLLPLPRKVFGHRRPVRKGEVKEETVEVNL